MAVELSELNLLDDLDIETATPEKYQDPTGPAPLAAGKYRFRLLEWDFDRDKEGNIRNLKTPTVVLNLEVVEGPAQGRKVRFLRVRSNVFERNGEKVSPLGDLLRAFDANSHYSGKEKFEALSRYQAEGATFEARVDWRAFDIDHYKAMLGGHPSPDKLMKRTAGDAATIKGMKRFPQMSNGNYSPTVIGPSGNELKAELEITDFVPNK
jgi:hypothetical protein